MPAHQLIFLVSERPRNQIAGFKPMLYVLSLNTGNSCGITIVSGMPLRSIASTTITLRPNLFDIATEPHTSLSDVMISSGPASAGARD